METIINLQEDLLVDYQDFHQSPHMTDLNQNLNEEWHHEEKVKETKNESDHSDRLSGLNDLKGSRTQSQDRHSRQSYSSRSDRSNRRNRSPRSRSREHGRHASRGKSPSLQSIDSSDNFSVKPHLRSMKLSDRIGVFNLPYDITEVVIREYFSLYGKITDFHLCHDRRGGSRGFCFITYERIKDARSAVEDKDRKLLNGRIVRVEFAVDRHNGLPSKRQQSRNYSNTYDHRSREGRYRRDEKFYGRESPRRGRSRSSPRNKTRHDRSVKHSDRHQGRSRSYSHGRYRSNSRGRHHDHDRDRHNTRHSSPRKYNRRSFDRSRERRRR